MHKVVGRAARLGDTRVGAEASSPYTPVLLTLPPNQGRVVETIVGSAMQAFFFSALVKLEHNLLKQHQPNTCELTTKNIAHCTTFLLRDSD